MGATEFAPKIRKRYQTNELVVDSTEFGTRGSKSVLQTYARQSKGCDRPPEHPIVRLADASHFADRPAELLLT